MTAGETESDPVKTPTQVALMNNGFNVFRCAAHPARHDEDEVGLTWQIAPALTDLHNFAAVGDLIIRSRTTFCGVQILCYLGIPGHGEQSLTDDDWPLADALIQANVEALTHSMYDYAAQTARSILSGFINPPKVPQRTPAHVLLLAGEASEPQTVELDEMNDEL